MDILTQSIPVAIGLGAADMIPSQPGAIIGPIAWLFGHIINFIFTGISSIGAVNALGFSIIIITLIVRGALVPSQLKMQQNTRKTQMVKPEMDKIRAKYGNSKDPELRRKMAAEIQALNQKHGINMLASCLPLLVTMPVFIALFAVFGRAFYFIPGIGEVYTNLSQALIDLGPTYAREYLVGIVGPYVNTNNFDFSGANGAFDFANYADLNRALHVMRPESWDAIFASLSGAELATIQYYYDAKMSVQSFFGLDLVTSSGWGWPGILIPILSVLTMAYSSWQMSKLNPATDPQTKMMQRIMLFVFPLLFGYFTIIAASGVGLYWVAGNLFLIAQNLIVFKFFPHKIDPTSAKEKK